LTAGISPTAPLDQGQFRMRQPSDSMLTRAARRALRQRRQLTVERLEPRTLLALAPPGSELDALLSGHGGLCNCPICTGRGLEQLPPLEQSGPAGPEAAPLSALPQLSSNPSATAKLYLDFNGHFQATWGSYSNASTPVFDQDGDASTFSSGELATIQEVWARVSEDYAPFDIDVTTINPGSLADQVVAHIAIGGNWSDWYGASAGGVAYVGGFYNFAPNVGYVFEAALANGHARYVAEAASHEAGHLFGLSHQAEWNGPILVDPYFAGDANWAPIMGVGYNSVRTTWHDGPTPAGPSAFQNDLAILANASNGFGYRADDYGGSIATAAALPVSGTSVGVSGIVGSTSDLDVFSFDTSGGAINVQLSVSSVGPNLNSMLRLWDSDGTLLVAAAPSGSLGASISTTIGPGTFYLVAGSAGGYGNVGRYTISGTVPEALPPEVAVSVGGVDQPNGNTVDFGQTTPGSPLSQVFTVHNTGPGFLELTPLSADDLPDGFEIVANLGSTLLASGATTTFELRLTAVEAGMFGGDLEIGTSDSDENPFVLSLSGEVAGPEIGLRLGSVSIADGGTANFGATFVGTPLERTFTVQNTGTTTLTLAALNPASRRPASRWCRTWAARCSRPANRPPSSYG
jgi:hypothetical protein